MKMTKDLNTYNFMLINHPVVVIKTATAACQVEHV